ncbi:MAG: ATP-binding cassette domain-containing protein, partial [Deltaproteobacteria bacterium]|nr:ATP-binding cassette domain-containing protein [Deltaproteobacteria bacterium]
MTEPVIQAQNLVKRFNGVTAVDDVSFSVRDGSTTALLGGNGAGKTTTLSMLVGLLLPDSGSLRVLGEDMLLHRHRVLPRLNYTSPYVDLPHRLTVRENLRVFSGLYRVADKARRLEELTEELNLKPIIDTPCGG